VPRRLTRALKGALVGVAFALALVGVWELLVRARWFSPVLLPPPRAVAAWLAGALRDGTLGRALGVTLRRLLAGYALGVVIGLPLGLLTARFRTCARTIGVLALGLQALPSVCWVPLALLWFGQTEAAMLFVVVMGTTWSVVIATDSGARTVPPIYARAARTMGATPLYTWVAVILPASLPSVVGGMKQGWAFAWRSLMAAEVYVTILSGLGLGHLMHYGRELHAMDQVLGVMLVIIVVGLTTDRLLFGPVVERLRRRFGVAMP